MQLLTHRRWHEGWASDAVIVLYMVLMYKRHLLQDKRH